MNKPPKYKIAFDGVKYTTEETKQAYLDLFKVLQRIQLRQIQESKDIVGEKKRGIVVEAIKEQKEIYDVFDEYFDTILAGLKESKKRKKPKKKDKG